MTDLSLTMSLHPGQHIDGKYRIVRLIGEGGMGAVYEGENTLISRRVAIKVLHAAVAANDAAVLRFEREAQAAGRIGSDHILDVLDLGELEGGDRYMVMEFLEGEELSSRMERLGPLPASQLAPLIQQTLVGLRAAHQAGIIHRDLKPDNLFIVAEKAGQRDFVKIIDFGISKFAALSGDMAMTSTGAIMGTPYYMSPEQARGAGGVDARSDLYAVGVIMYEALSGSVPFDGVSFNELMFKIVLADTPTLPKTVPEDFATIVHRAMKREASERYQSADEMLQAVEAWLASKGLRGSSHAFTAPLSSGAVQQLGFTGNSASGGVSAHVPAISAKSPAERTNGNFAATNGAAPIPSGRQRKGKAVLLLGALALAASGATLALVAPRLKSASGISGADASARAEEALGPAEGASRGNEVPAEVEQEAARLDTSALGQAVESPVSVPLHDVAPAKDEASDAADQQNLSATTAELPPQRVAEPARRVQDRPRQAVKRVPATSSPQSTDAAPPAARVSATPETSRQIKPKAPEPSSRPAPAPRGGAKKTDVPSQRIERDFGY